MSTLSDCSTNVSWVNGTTFFSASHSVFIKPTFKHYFFGNVVEIVLFFFSFFLAVCVSFLDRFYQSLKDNDVKFNSADIEKAFIKACKDAKGKENRLVSIFLTLVVSIVVMTN